MSNQPVSPDPSPDGEGSSRIDRSQARALIGMLSSDRFATWRRLREQQRNREDGYGDTRNDPSYQQDPTTHSPSNLLSCHRMVEYRSQNAPAESGLPHGLFEFGHHFESLVETFLRDSSAPGQSVQNPVPIEFTIDDGAITIEGSTDPVVFDESGTPLLLTECKSTGTLRYIARDGPHERHRAQAHAYAMGLTRKFDLESLPPICYLYGNRETLAVLTVSEPFDVPFWTETVRPWIRSNTGYRSRVDLAPTVDEEKEFMCQYCDYASRCGNPSPGPFPTRINEIADEDSAFADSDELIGDADFWFDDEAAPGVKRDAGEEPIKGFLPCHEYPEETVVGHLLTFDDVALTPTVAHQYPFLVTDGPEPPARIEAAYGAVPRRDVHDWVCPECGATYAYDRPSWDGDVRDRPSCGQCQDLPALRGPFPSEVYHQASPPADDVDPVEIASDLTTE